jgi:sirohydrochlorin ferrochelatase
MFARLARFAAVVVAAHAPVVAAQGTPREAASVGAVIVAHGGGKAWNDRVRELVNASGMSNLEIAFLMGEEAPSYRFQDAVNRLESRGVSEIVVLPLLVSSHSGHYEQIRWLAGATDSLDTVMREHLAHAGIEPVHAKVPLRVAAALDDSPALARVLADRARALATDAPRQALFLLGHGPNSAEDYAAWMENLRRVADSVKAATGFRDVRVDLVRDDAPKAVRAEAVRRIREIISLQHEVTGRDVVVVPILVSTGGSSRGPMFTKDLDGLPIVYGKEPLLPHAALVDWIRARISEGAGAMAGQHGRD